LNSSSGCCCRTLDVLGTRLPAWIPIIHDVLEIRNNYVSINVVVVQNERPTTRFYLSIKSHGWAIIKPAS